jgi:SP family general alpha glucoside:H+ symporter-like MFS transporter
MASSRVVGDIAPLPTTTGAMDGKDQDQIERVKALDQMIHNARSATEKEHKMTLLQGIKLYPKAIFWSILISTTIVMEGYDVCLINNFCNCSTPLFLGQALGTDSTVDGFPQFNRKYGEQLPSGEWQVPARWQSGLSNGWGPSVVHRR